MNRKGKKIGVIGYGRFGSLWAHMLAETGNEVCVYDPHISHDSLPTTHSGIYMVELSQLKDVDIVFFCVPISQLKDSIQRSKSFLHSHCVVCDTCSVKEYPMEWMRELLSDTQEIVGMHPLFGPDSVEENKHRKLIVCRERIGDANYDMLITILTTMNLNIIEMSATDHDKQSVFSQGLTHLIGRVLKELPLQKEDVTTKGFEALLEIIAQTCKDSTVLFHDIQNYNKGSQAMWVQLQQALDKTLHEITNFRED